MLSQWFEPSSVSCQTSSSSSQPPPALRYLWEVPQDAVSWMPRKKRWQNHLCKRSALGPSCSPQNSHLTSTMKWNCRGSFLFSSVGGVLLESPLPSPELPFSQDDRQWENALPLRKSHFQPPTWHCVKHGPVALITITSENNRLGLSWWSSG